MCEGGKQIKFMYAGLAEESATNLQGKENKITFSKTESTVSLKNKKQTV